MSRRTLLACASLVICCGSVLAAPSRPNFVFILTDDQSPETLRAYGNTVCQTPNIDRLAAEGILLQDAHHMGAWSGAVCTPSRTMIMTGRTVWRIPGAKGTASKSSKSFRQQAAQQSMPAVFNRAGYDTFRTCKKGNSFQEANDLFAVSKVATRRGGTDETGSKWHGDQVIDFLTERMALGDKDPFLIYFGFSHPHDPRDATPELAAKYGAPTRRFPPHPIRRHRRCRSTICRRIHSLTVTPDCVTKRRCRGS